METVAKENKPVYNWLKLSEELAELQERTIKYIVKPEDKKPTKEDLAEEIGDVLLRIVGVMSTDKRLEDLVNARLTLKASKLRGYYDSGKYKGGV